MYGDIVLSAFKDLAPSSRAVIFPRLGPSLHCMPTAAGYEIRENRGYDWHGLRRGKESFVLFQYTLGGCGMLEYEGRRQEVLPGAAMFLFFPHDNRYWLPTGGRWEFFYLCFNGSEILRIWKNLISQRGPLVALSPDCPCLHIAANACLQILRNEVTSPWSASSLSYHVAMALFEDLHPPQADSKSHDRPEPIKDAITYSHEHLALPIGVEDLARAAGYSRFHFTRLFLKTEGIGPGEYLCRLRMQKAVELLKFTKDSVKEIAHQCGFRSSGYFGKVFHKVYGLSPGDFRNSGMY